MDLNDSKVMAVINGHQWDFISNIVAIAVQARDEACRRLALYADPLVAPRSRRACVIDERRFRRMMMTRGD
jgi:hypothetical protein